MTNLVGKHTLAALLVVAIFTTSGVRSWSPTGNNHPPNTQGTTNLQNHPDNPSSRRKLLQQALAGAAVAVAPQRASAACLQGDIRPVCIGIYKVPQDDAFKNYIGTPEQLQKFAPDLVYVPPTPPPESFGDALDILKTQRIAAESIKQNVAAGNLEEAGVGVLGLIPLVTTSGKYILEELEGRVYRKQQKAAAAAATAAAVEAKMVAAPVVTGGGEEVVVVNNNNNGDNNDDGYDEHGYKRSTTAEELAVDMASNQMDYVNGFFGECDVVIGQGIRGELGVSAVAQLTILSSLRDATGALDDFLVTAMTLGAKI